MDKKFQTITCQTHSGKEIVFIDPTVARGYALACEMCLLEKGLDVESLILLDQVLRQQSEDESRSNNETIENWPAFILKQKIKLTKKFSVFNKQNIINRTIEYYDKLEKDTVQSIRQIKKRVVNNIERIEDHYDGLNAFYDISNKQRLELADIIFSNHGSFKELNEKLVVFFHTQLESAIVQNIQIENIIIKQFVQKNSYKEEILRSVKDLSLNWLQSLSELKDLNITLNDEVELEEISSQLKPDLYELSYYLSEMQKKYNYNIQYITDPLKYILKYPEMNKLIQCDEQKEQQNNKSNVSILLEFKIPHENKLITIEQKGLNCYQFTQHYSPSPLSDSTNLIISKNHLEKDKKYIVRWKFNKPLNQMEMNIGLMSSSNIQSGNTFEAFYQGSFCVGKINISNAGPLHCQNSITEVELRIDFLNNIFHTLNYPSYNFYNYVQKNTHQYLDNEDYYLFIEFLDNNFREITITSFDVVEKLPDFTYQSQRK